MTIPTTLVRRYEAAALCNVRALIADARLLHAHGRLSRCFGVGILTVEEFAKLIALFTVGRSTDQTGFDWPRIEKELRNHEIKLGLVIAFLREHAPDASVRARFESAIGGLGGDSHTASRLQQHKLKSFYSGIWAGRVLDPQSAISQKQVDGVMEVLDGIEMVLESINWER